MGVVQRQNQKQKPYGEAESWGQEGHQDDVREIPSTGGQEAEVRGGLEEAVLDGRGGLQEATAWNHWPYPDLWSRSCRAEKGRPVD